jgi:hypothetical protein
MSILNASDPKDHSRFRKAMEPGFTERAVRNQEVITQRSTSALISQLGKLVEREEGGTVVDIVRWYGFTIFDLIGDLGFGESFNCLQSKEFHPYVEMIFNSLRAATLRSSLRYYPSLDWLFGLAIPKSVMKK